MDNAIALFDVVYEDRIHCPRSLIVEIISPTSVIVLTEGHGQGYRNPQHFMNQSQWLEWFARFEDELTGKEFREARQHAMAPASSAASSKAATPSSLTPALPHLRWLSQ